MQFNEFQRRLSRCHLDEDTKYLLTHLFEVQIECSKQLDITAGVLDALVNSVQQFVALHHSTQEKVKQLLRAGHVDGVEVHSVRNEPEE